MLILSPGALSGTILITHFDFVPYNGTVHPFSVDDFVNLNNLQHHIVGKDFFGDDDYTLLKSLLVADYFVTKEQLPRFAIHWCSTAFKTGNWSKEKYNFDRPVNISTYNVLLKRFGIE